MKLTEILQWMRERIRNFLTFEDEVTKILDDLDKTPSQEETPRVAEEVEEDHSSKLVSTVIDLGDDMAGKPKKRKSVKKVEKVMKKTCAAKVLKPMTIKKKMK